MSALDNNGTDNAATMWPLRFHFPFAKYFEALLFQFYYTLKILVQ